MMKSLSVNAQEFIPSKNGAYSSTTPPVSAGGSTPVAFMLLNDNSNRYPAMHAGGLSMAMRAATHQIPPAHPSFIQPAPPSIMPIQQPMSALAFSNLNDLNYFYHQPQHQPAFQPPFRFVQPMPTNTGQTSSTHSILPSNNHNNNNNDQTKSKIRPRNNRQFYTEQQQTNRSKSTNSNNAQSKTNYNSFNQTTSPPNHTNSMLLMNQSFIPPVHYNIPPPPPPPPPPLQPAVASLLPPPSHSNNPTFNNCNNPTSKLNTNFPKLNKGKFANLAPISLERPKFAQKQNQTNESKKPNAQRKNFELNKQDEESWPGLPEKSSKSPQKESESMSDEEKVDEEMVAANKEPYVSDEGTLKKLIKNVNFIKRTVEQHYLSQNGGRKNPASFSFKEVLVQKRVAPVKPAEPVAIEEKKIIDSAVLSEPEGKAKRKSARRKRGARKSSSRPSSDKEANEEKLAEFDLTHEDFPSLNQNQTQTKLKSLNRSMSSLEERSNLQSDAYSSDATLGAITKSKSVEPLKKSKSPSQKTTINKNNNDGKKTHTPIILEFANMISALEKGQKSEKSQQHSRHSSVNSGASSARFSKQPSVRSLQQQQQQQQQANPLDSCPSLLSRGKERLKPKNKKHSTLKKIILREREEKRRLRQKSSKSDEIVELDKNEKSQDGQIENSKEGENNEEKASESDDVEEDEEEENKEEEGEEEGEEDEQVNGETAELQTNNNNNNNAQSNVMSPISQGSPVSIGGYTPTAYTLNMIVNNRTLLSLEKLEEQVKQKIHSRKFREYCNQIINSDIDEVCTLLLHEIVRFQDRMYHKNPVKAKTKRRYVMGIREVTKHLKLNRVKCVILAPNCEKIESKGGLDDAINFIIQTAMENNVPFVFALGRKGLGKAVNKLVPISVVAIFDYSGAEEFFKRLVNLANNAKLAYQEMIEEYEKEECENLLLAKTKPSSIHQNQASQNFNLTAENRAINETAPTHQTSNPVSQMINPNYNYQMALGHNPAIPSHMGHSRTPSNGSNISIEPFYHMNYHTHSRSASGNFNFGPSNGGGGGGGGHSRSASGGGGGTLNIDLTGAKHWTHSRTPSNCSNISFISRLSEPMSEVGCVLLNNPPILPFYIPNPNSMPNSQMNSAYAAVQYYTEQVRQEMHVGREICIETSNTLQQQQLNDNLNKATEENSTMQASLDCGKTNNSTTAINGVSSSLVNLHLGCIDEIDAGNEADTEDYGDAESGKSRSKTLCKSDEENTN